MPSPFPGMDPWLERPSRFPHLHGALIYVLQTALAAALPEGYVAASDSRVWVDPELRRDPDVSVFGPDDPPADRAAERAGAFAAAGMVAVAARKVREPRRERYLEILADDGERLVTAVEVVSPSNKKRGPGRVSYRQKQNEFAAAGVGLVEIDLLRAGPHTTAVPERAFRRAAGACDYHACVTAWDDPRGEARHYVAPIRLADRLPTVPVPLDPGVEPVPIDLQAVFTRAYNEGRFDKLARYDRPCDPPLTPEQLTWAAEVLARRAAT